MVNEVGTLLFNQDVFNKMMSYEKGGLVALSCVSRQFTALAIEFAKTYRPEGCFGKVQWLNYKGETYLKLKVIQEFNLIKHDAIVSTFKKVGENKYEFELNFFDINASDELKTNWIVLSKDVFPGILEKIDLLDTVASLLLHASKDEVRYFNKNYKTVFLHANDPDSNCPILVGKKSGVTINIKDII